MMSKISAGTNSWISGVDNRLDTESTAQRVAKVAMPTEHGMFSMIGYRNLADGSEHLALVHGEPASRPSPLVRVHSECFTGDVLGSLRCDCGPQLDGALRAIVAEGAGVVVYLRQEGRGIGLLNKLRAYELQERGFDTVEANLALGFVEDGRDYRIGADMLRDLGISSIRLLSNNPEKLSALSSHGITVSERVPLVIQPVPENRRYMETKERKMGHLYRLGDSRGLVSLSFEDRKAS
ncbi:MAG: GTP cyclohydrolase II [Blastocatellia bacterium]|jgi:3,4-dihydroxy 2-butanone 4-phosphate synthase/GTP cyclohydrolase II